MKNKYVKFITGMMSIIIFIGVPYSVITNNLALATVICFCGIGIGMIPIVIKSDQVSESVDD